MKLILLLRCAFGLKWLLDSGSYFSVKNLQRTLELGLMWGNEYKLNHEMTETSILVSVPYADPGKYYVQKVYDPAHSLEIVQAWKIQSDSWEMEFQGSHKGKTEFDNAPKLVNLIVFGAVLDGFLDYTDGKWAGTFDFTVKTSHEIIVKTVSLSDISDKSWKVKKIVQKMLYDSYVTKHSGFGSLTPSTDPKSNFFFIQMQAISPFTITLTYNSPPSFPDYEALYASHYKFSFGVPIYPKFEYNLLGLFNSGLTYLQGKIQVAEKVGGKSTYSESGNLLSFVPSRVSFPRGFLWDEGFHLLIACNWDIDICIDVFSSWMGTMDENGWIPREQIRGPASETRVPSQFIVQSKDIANPPSLLLLVDKLLGQIQDLPPELQETSKEYKVLKKNYKKLINWMNWLRNTQQNLEGLPMWKGRTAGHNLASGLDDYPRGLQVSENERHLDLYMWLLMFHKTMINLATSLNEQEDMMILTEITEDLEKKSEFFVNDNAEFSDYLGEQFVTPSGQQAYYWRGDQKCKVVLSPLGIPAECNPYSEYPCCSEFGWCGNTPQHCSCEKCEKAQRLENRKNLVKTSLFSSHIGYVSLMPFVVGFVKPKTTAFEKIMEYIYDPEFLWSKHGLRSLAKKDLLFKTGENYWRGEIWLNFNFLVLRAMKKFYWEDEMVRNVYEELRGNIVNTVVKSWEKTGYVWEQYNEDNGSGQRVHPFTGWSTLILNIIHEKY